MGKSELSKEFKEHWEDLILKIEKNGCLSKEQYKDRMHEFEIAKINEIESRPPYMFTFALRNELDRLEQKLRYALDVAYNRYQKQTWWYKLLSNIEIKINKIGVHIHFPLLPNNKL